MTGALVRGGVWTQAHREGKGAEPGIYRPRTVSSQQKVPDTDSLLPESLWREAGPAHTLTLDFRPP